MSRWSCGLEDCGATYEDVADLLAHQVTDHPLHECAVCGETVPDGYYAIEHVFTEHTRAKYVRYYDGDSDAIRYRENLIEDVSSRTDPDTVRERAERERDDAADTDYTAASADD